MLILDKLPYNIHLFGRDQYHANKRVALHPKIMRQQKSSWLAFTVKSLVFFEVYTSCIVPMVHPYVVVFKQFKSMFLGCSSLLIIYIHTLHYITLHYITLHYITLHYITLHT